MTDLVEQYLTEVIEDRSVTDPRTGEKKRVPGARKPKGQWEVRRTLHNDVVRVLGGRPAAEVKRKEKERRKRKVRPTQQSRPLSAVKISSSES